MRTSGIRPPFGGLSRSPGQVPHVLLTRSPLGLPQCCHCMDLVRLACVRHAASVRPEPGSNSPSRSQVLHRGGSPSIGLKSRRSRELVKAPVLCRLAPEQPAILLSVSSAFILERLRDPPRRAGQSPALAVSSSLLFSRSVDRPDGQRSTGSRILSGAVVPGWPFRWRRRCRGLRGAEGQPTGVLGTVSTRGRETC